MDLKDFGSRPKPFNLQHDYLAMQRTFLFSLGRHMFSFSSHQQKLVGHLSRRVVTVFKPHSSICCRPV